MKRKPVAATPQPKAPSTARSGVLTPTAASAARAKRAVDSAGAALTRAPGMTGPALSFVRFDWSGDRSSLDAWLRDALASAATAAAPIRTVRLLERTGEHPELKTTYPHFAAVIEWANKGMPAAGPAESAAAKLGPAASAVSCESFSKRFGLVREGVFD